MGDELSAQIYETWQRMAPGWERLRDSIWDVSAHVGGQLVDAVDPQPGETVLELAAGVGDTGLLAAERVGPGGKLISSDFSPSMVEAARRRAAELGVDGVEFRVLDAQALDLPDASIDAVLCRWGYMLMPDPAAALSETRRVLKRDGRLAFSVWGPPEANPWAALPGRILIERGHMEPPSSGRPGVFALADSGRLEALVREAGFDDARIDEVAMHWRFEGFDDYWTFVLEKAGALSMVIVGLLDAEQEAVREATHDAIGERARGAFELAGSCWNVLARPAAG